MARAGWGPIPWEGTTPRDPSVMASASRARVKIERPKISPGECARCTRSEHESGRHSVTAKPWERLVEENVSRDVARRGRLLWWQTRGYACGCGTTQI